MIDQKTIELLEWITPPENQGQHVTVSYANDGETVFQRRVEIGVTGWRIMYLCADIDTIWDNAEEWEYEPWNKEPIIPDFLWKEATNG